MQLVLSLFPGAGLLDMAFEAEGFCVVRGPDALLGGDVRGWRVPAGRFDGVIGGPPCQEHSKARRLGGVAGPGPRHADLVPEFARLVVEAAPSWWLMENVPEAPLPGLAEFWSAVLDAVDYGAPQRRRRRFSSNLELGRYLEPVALRHPDPWPTVTATEHKVGAAPADRRWMRARAARKVGRRLTLAEVAGAMGLEAVPALPALRVEAQYEALGNGVPLPMGRALARAVRAAVGEVLP
jgi:DNA (cytosine-5)-methyltransferase 1